METEDGNEDVCGACTDIGDLICCESCPAAYHAECAGYGEDAYVYAADQSADRAVHLQMLLLRAVNPQEVPAGDWYCWSCCLQSKRGFPFPSTRVRNPYTAMHSLITAAVQILLQRGQQQHVQLNSTMCLAVPSGHWERCVCWHRGAPRHLLSSNLGAFRPRQLFCPIQ